MFSFILHYRTAWNDYFPGTNPTTTLSPKEYTSRESVSDTYVYVSNCLFNKCSSSSDGGALYCSSVTYLLVESSSFFSCKTSSKFGGAIYFSNTNSGECVLHKLCCYDCLTTYTSGSYGQFANIEVRRSYISYSSIVRCVNDDSDSWHTLRHVNGNICCPSVNFSMNKCAYRSGIYFSPSSDSSSITCSLLYSSFADNNASNYNCFIFFRSNTKYEMKCCNVLRNRQASDSNGIIETKENVTIEDSCILENTANYVFYAYSSSNIITLLNCTVDKTTTNLGSLIIQSTVSRSFILALSHMSTRNCHAEYDAIGTLTPIIQPLCPTMNQKLYYTCKRFFNQPHLRDFVSLMWVFIFNIIHPSPSV
jgi:hypothetical protein